MRPAGGDVASHSQCLWVIWDLDLWRCFTLVLFCSSWTDCVKREGSFSITLQHSRLRRPGCFCILLQETESRANTPAYTHTSYTFSDVSCENGAHKCASSPEGEVPAVKEESQGLQAEQKRISLVLGCYFQQDRCKIGNSAETLSHWKARKHTGQR